MRAPRRPINPELLRQVLRSRAGKKSLAVVAGFKHYDAFFHTLRAASVPATPTTIERLHRVANAVGFRGRVFLVGNHVEA